MERRIFPDDASSEPIEGRNTAQNRPQSSRSRQQEELDRAHARLIELELQNAELRAAQEELERLRHATLELYDASPVGFVLLDKSGVVLRANRTLGEMLGAEPRRMLHKPFLVYVMRETLNDYRAACREAIVTRQRVACDVLLRPRDREPVRARMEMAGMHEPETGELVCHVAVIEPGVTVSAPTVDTADPDEA